ncbi:hypothetical protein O181_050302 [Austropuccinia psidii MF-1]|uniref:Uncharacterized protein n=1 Tax=Austropuccinia psidii MF-1 TaxID=1389203 RepID=A0A9Q3E3D8_9BASI|nr:hypothetical protein [Austropuccinia psidii MF-1]
MPEPQRTDGGGAEGEDSVCSKKMTSREWGDSSMMAPLKVSKVVSQGGFGTEFTTKDLPCNFGEVSILMVLDPLNGSRPWATLLVPRTPKVPEKLGPGASNSPHGLRHTDPGPWTVGPQKPQMAKNGHR